MSNKEIKFKIKPIIIMRISSNKLKNQIYLLIDVGYSHIGIIIIYLFKKYILFARMRFENGYYKILYS